MSCKPVIVQTLVKPQALNTRSIVAASRCLQAQVSQLHRHRLSKTRLCTWFQNNSLRKGVGNMWDHNQCIVPACQERRCFKSSRVKMNERSLTNTNFRWIFPLNQERQHNNEGKKEAPETVLPQTSQRCRTKLKNSKDYFFGRSATKLYLRWFFVSAFLLCHILVMYDWEKTNRRETNPAESIF